LTKTQTDGVGRYFQFTRSYQTHNSIRCLWDNRSFKVFIILLWTVSVFFYTTHRQKSTIEKKLVTTTGHLAWTKKSNSLHQHTHTTRTHNLLYFIIHEKYHPTADAFLVNIKYNTIILYYSQWTLRSLIFSSGGLRIKFEVLATISFNISRSKSLVLMCYVDRYLR